MYCEQAPGHSAVPDVLMMNHQQASHNTSDSFSHLAIISGIMAFPNRILSVTRNSAILSALRFNSNGGSNKPLLIKWIHKDGRESLTAAAIGDSLLEVAHQHGIELEGACEGVCACSTCHVILEKGVYDALPEPTEEEEDMLDRAFGLTATSRLGCQVKLQQQHDILVVKLPKATRNFYVVSDCPSNNENLLFNEFDAGWTHTETTLIILIFVVNYKWTG